jgi:hypothetical protein
MVTGGLRRFLVTFIKNVTFVFWRWTDRRWKTRYCIAVYFVLQYTVQYIIPIQQYYCTILFYCTPIKDTTATTATPRPYCSSLQYSSYLLQSYQLEPLISSNQQYGNHHSIKRNYLFTPTQISKEFDASYRGTYSAYTHNIPFTYRLGLGLIYGIRRKVVTITESVTIKT